jgi:hypothetical protein
LLTSHVEFEVQQKSIKQIKLVMCIEDALSPQS